MRITSSIYNSMSSFFLPNDFYFQHGTLYEHDVGVGQHPCKNRAVASVNWQ